MAEDNKIACHKDYVEEKTQPAHSYFFKEGMREGLEALHRASASAYDAGADPWDFALRIDLLHERGLSITNLRWLVAKGYVEHGNDTSRYGQAHRSFESGAGFRFDSATCFVLTPLGISDFPKIIPNAEENVLTISQELKNGGLDLAPSRLANSQLTAKCSNGKPYWNAARRELLLDNVLIKKFRVPAHNQEWVLQSFEDEDWPESIDDPLPTDFNTCPKARLRDTISRLNRKQINPYLRFRGNGTGRAICWEVLVIQPEK